MFSAGNASTIGIFEDDLPVFFVLIMLSVIFDPTLNYIVECLTIYYEGV